MTTRSGLSVLEVLLAAALLAMIVAACLPLMAPTPAGVPLRADPQLVRIAMATPIATPPNASVERFDSTVEGEINGTWVVIVSGDRFALVWTPADPSPAEDRP